MAEADAHAGVVEDVEAAHVNGGPRLRHLCHGGQGRRAGDRVEEVNVELESDGHTWGQVANGEESEDDVGPDQDDGHPQTLGARCPHRRNNLHRAMEFVALGLDHQPEFAEDGSGRATGLRRRSRHRGIRRVASFGDLFGHRTNDTIVAGGIDDRIRDASQAGCPTPMILASEPPMMRAWCSAGRSFTIPA